MFLSVRLIVREDLSAVESIANQFEYNSWSHAVFADCMKPDYKGWVLVDDQDRVHGFLIVLMGKDECQIMNIGIAPRYQQQGYGKLLLGYLIDYLKSLMNKHILLEVRASNRPAIKLYQSMGFVQIGTRQGYYPVGNQREDALIFSLLIDLF